jgi:hypothetical protein
MAIEKSLQKKEKFVYSSVELLTLPAPDGNKIFDIVESYGNGVYASTSSALSWSSGGGAVFYFYEQGKFVTARWINSHTLEIRHDPTIQFAKKETRFFYAGDQGDILYVPMISL